MTVYFLRPVGMDGPVKIGFAGVPENRVITYSALSPFPLEIVARIAGGEDLERRFHTRFASQRSHHEWFHASPELTATIEAVAAGTFDIASLPEGRKLPSKRPAPCLRRSVNQSLRVRLTCSKRLGVDAPDHVSAALTALYRASDDAEWSRNVETVEEYLKDPLRHGVPIKARWAEKAREAHGEGRARRVRARAGIGVSA